MLPNTTSQYLQTNILCCLRPKVAVVMMSEFLLLCQHDFTESKVTWCSL